MIKIDLIKFSNKQEKKEILNYLETKTKFVREDFNGKDVKYDCIYINKNTNKYGITDLFCMKFFFGIENFVDKEEKIEHNTYENLSDYLKTKKTNNNKQEKINGLFKQLMEIFENE